MSPITVSAACMLLFATAPIAFGQSAPAAANELVQAHMHWSQDNYGAAREAFGAYLKKHDADSPPPYEARAYYASSLCRSVSGVADGRRMLLKTQRDLDTRINIRDRSFMLPVQVANISVFVEKELARCTASGCGPDTATTPMISWVPAVPSVLPRRPGISGKAQIVKSLEQLEHEQMLRNGQSVTDP